MEVIRNGKSEHVSAEIGALLVAAGLATVATAKPEIKHDITWFANAGVFIDDYQAPPTCGWRCSCGERQTTESMKGTAHLNHVHRGRLTCDPDVAATYTQLFAKWKSRSRVKPPKQVVSRVSPDSHIRAAGLQTSDELKRGLQFEVERASLAKLI
ncbi:MAG TPA: hypothetical protein VJN92_15615 [Candidatus Acidoferrum sp.]|nr:hypothetical protein [Candidatus Acidoferrum sp.]